MSIETSTSSMSSVSTTSNVSQNSASVSSKTSSDTSFKDEMDKVSSTETKEVKDTKNESEKPIKETESRKDKLVSKEKTNIKDDDKKENDLILMGKIGFNDKNQILLNDANQMLVDDIQQMAEVYSKFSDWNCTCGDNKFSLSMSETDAQFFINLTSTEDISVQNITVQAQNILNSGVEAKEVQQSFQVSQTLLNALNEARQNNQPIRIDFDNNMAVVLRVNQNGSISANFIPGDKIVEQYLRQNIDSLRNTFDEKNLPYSDLSYSNSSKEQNRRRRNEQQQGE